MGVLEAILAVFSAVMTWIGTSFQTLEPIFYNATEDALTFMGVLGVAGLSFSVVFLLLGILQRFLKFGA